VSRFAPQWWCPAADGDAVDSFAAELTKGGMDVRRQQPLASWTTLGVGGNARVFVELADDQQLTTFMSALGKTDAAQVPLLVLGRGSNILLADSGWPGVAVRLGAAFKHFERNRSTVRAGAAASMPALAAWCATQRLAGLEFAAGIPATVGGSVRMNAGAHGGEVAQRLSGVDIVVPGDERVRTFAPAELAMSYRHSDLPPRSIVVAATWELYDDDADAIRDRLDELRSWRRSTQPLRQRNCGSVFTNPSGDSAGRLVDAAGMKGHRRGGAQVSDKHANFIVVDPMSRAVDVYCLIAEIRKAVSAAGGPVLEPEVRIVGDFSDAAGCDG
jgi:UDP-N-acetylmuramate dehydrogenase